MLVKQNGGSIIVFMDEYTSEDLLATLMALDTMIRCNAIKLPEEAINVLMQLEEGLALPEMM